MIKSILQNIIIGIIINIKTTLIEMDFKKNNSLKIIMVKIVIMNVIMKIIMRKIHIIIEIKVIITIIDIKSMILMVIIKMTIININMKIFININL